MEKLTLYRKRLIPNECIPLKDDILVSRNEDVIVTKWNTLNPKTAFQYGASCYFLKKGIKVSKFYRADGSLFCWYCDIVRFDFSEQDTILTVTDLLADVILYPDGTVKVADLDELAEAFKQGLISSDELILSLKQLNDLLTTIYEDRFSTLQAELNQLGL